MANAFGLVSFDWSAPLPEDERDAMLAKVVAVVRKWRLEFPAMLFLESTAPLGHAVGQGLVAFSPFAAPLLAGGIEGVQKLHALLEDPKNIQRLIELLAETEFGTETGTDAARK